MLEGTLRRSFGAPPSVPASDTPVSDHCADRHPEDHDIESQANSNILTEQMTKSFGPVGTTLQSRMMLALDEFKAALEHAVPGQRTVASGASAREGEVSCSLSVLKAPPMSAATAIGYLGRTASALLLAAASWFGGGASAADRAGNSSAPITPASATHKITLSVTVA